MDRTRARLASGTVSTKRAPIIWLQWMPGWLEFGLIFGLTLWPFVYSSVRALLTILPDAPIDQGHLSSLISLEIYALAFVVPLMAARGWTLATLGLRFEWRDLVSAPLLLLLAYAGSMALWLLLSALLPDAASSAAHVHLVTSKFSLETLFAASILNGFFEELFVTGYLFQTLRTKVGDLAAINTSVFVRLLYHLYQGSIGVVGIVPVGVLFAWSYARTGRLWPLIMAHILADFISLVQYVN